MVDHVGKILIILGIVLVVVGIILCVGGRYIDFGKLPGDLKWSSGNTTVYFPIATCIILSIILSIIANIFF